MTTITIDRAVVEQALEACEQSETFVPYEGFGMARKEAERKHQAAITALRAALAQQAEPETCTWHQDGDSDSGVYATSCRHYFNLEDGTPEDNKMQWCCYCGKKLAQELITEDDDDRPTNRRPAGAGGVAVALPPRTQQYPRRVPSED